MVDLVVDMSWHILDYDPVFAPRFHLVRKTHADKNYAKHE